jgi:hypothetical protein
MNFRSKVKQKRLCSFFIGNHPSKESVRRDTDTRLLCHLASLCLQCSQLSMPVGKFLTQFKQQLPIYRIAPDSTQSRSKTKSKPIVALKTLLKSKSFKSSSKKKAEDDSIRRTQSDGLEELTLSMRCTSLPTSTARHPASQRPHRSTRRNSLQSSGGTAASGIDPRTNLSLHRNARTHTLKTEHAHAMRSSCEGYV